ncbi:MAG: hypothetical protein ABIO70_05205 [Pseudomonadota bacterium]
MLPLLRHRRFHRLLLAVAVAWVGMGTAMQVHHLQYRHVPCPLHPDELIHVHNAAGRVAPLLTGQPQGEHHHDHTLNTLATPSTLVFTPAIPAPEVRAWRFTPQRPGVVLLVGGILHLAPKTSPPSRA